ncbi:hypothetical protein [Rubritepida flocculans]|uniref:hypothetical protein n=1 Tax=Rubritepida flocculans TaxID=182403 RepID=UPI00041F1F14|nr:hypothetical protein [Rubritepida flocculans]
MAGAKGEADEAGDDHPAKAPMGVFPSAGKPIAIAACSPEFPEPACRAVFEDPQVRHLGMVWQVPHARPGQSGVVRTPLTIEGLRPGIRRPAPEPGVQAQEILAEAGLTQRKIGVLRAAGALGE